MTSTHRIATIFLLSLFLASPAGAYTITINLIGDGTKWEPGSGTASSFNPALPPGTPGAATWSLMPANVLISLGDLTFHNSTFLSTSVVGMTGLPDVGTTPYETWVIETALNQWAAVSGFTNLGEVADGPSIGGLCGTGLYNGCVEVGDIRIGGYPFNILSSSVTLAHTFQPGTTALDPPFGSIGGDMHLNNDLNPAAPNQLNWVDNPFDLAGNGSYDFYTVVLHELGHALGLGHSSDANSVMALYSTRGGALRTLAADDIAGIQAIYGPINGDPVPEPTTLLLLGTGLAAAGVRSRMKKRG